MIHNIEIENFGSIAEKQTITFAIPKNVPELPCFIASRGIREVRLPSVIGFFGANGSGKSTVLKAINAVILFVLHSFTNQINLGVPFFFPYMRQDWWDRPSKVLLEFDGELGPGGISCLFRYELQVEHATGNIANKVAKESLYYAPRGKFVKLFHRENDAFTFGKDFQITDSDARVKSIRSNASVLATLAQFNHPIAVYLMQSVADAQTNLVGSEKIQRKPESWMKFFATNAEYLAKLNRELQRLDIGLESMEIQQTPQGPVATFKHVGLDSVIHYSDESAGTRRFIELFPNIQYVLDTGATAFIDEIDSDFHPLLIRELFSWFYDTERNKNKAQLIFTAHNPFLLDEMEKEQIFFAEKKLAKPTQIYGAKEIKDLRRSPSLLRKYLMGELGALPHIG